MLQLARTGVEVVAGCSTPSCSGGSLSGKGGFGLLGLGPGGLCRLGSLDMCFVWRHSGQLKAYHKDDWQTATTQQHGISPDTLSAVDVQA